MSPVIKSFAGGPTKELWEAGSARRTSGGLARAAIRKLKMLDAAKQLGDLAAFAGNHLEKLKGDRAGEHSVRINDQYRICFVWKEGNAHEVEVVDHH